MPKYLSGRSKTIPLSGIKSDRYRYLPAGAAEPNLGDPLIGVSSMVAKPVPFGQQYIVVSVQGYPGERFWIPNQGGVIPGSISVFDEGNLVGGLSSVTQLNFVGSAVSAIEVTNNNVNIRVFSPGNNKEVLFNSANEFSTSSSFQFDSTVGLLTAGNSIHVGAGGTYFKTTTDGYVGIKTANPTQELDLNGNLRLRGTIYDYTNSPGTNAQLLVKNNFGGVIWIDSKQTITGAGGTYQNIQFHNSASLVDGAPNFVYDEINNRVGIGSTRPKVLLDVLGVSSFSGGVFIDNVQISGVTTTQTLAVSGTSTTRNLLVTGITTLGQLGGTSANFSGIVTASKFIGDIDVVNLSVTGVATIARLGVTGLTTTVDLVVTRNSNVSGISTFNGQVNINNLNVTGVGTFDNIKFDTNTVSTLSGNLILDSFAGTTQINDVVYVNNTTESINSSTGSIVTLGGVGIAKSLNVDGITRLATLGGITTTGGDLYVGGDLYIKDDIFYDEISGRRAEFTEYLQTKDFRATGISTLGITSISQLLVSGISTFNGTIDSNGGAYIDNIQIGITNDNQIDTTVGNLTIGSVGGLTTIDNRLRVTGISTFNDSSTFDGNILVSGISTFNGSVTLGDSILDTVTFTSRVNSNILPASNLTYNLGSTLARWNDIYSARFNGQFIGNADTATQVSTGTTTGTSAYYLTFVDSNNTTRGNEHLYTDSDISYNPSSDLLTVGKVYVSGISTFIGNSRFDGSLTLGDDSLDKVFVNASIASTVSVDVTDTYDLGASNSLRWKNVYAQTFNGQFIGNADTATQVSTGTTTGTSTYFLTFVDSDNAVRGNEYLYTDNEISYNPSTDLLSVGKIYVSGISTFIGNSRFDGNVIIGDSSSDRITINSLLDSNLLPNSVRDLGGPSNKWENLYVKNLISDGISNLLAFTIPETGSSSAWVKLGTFTAAQTGQTLAITVVAHSGYNASVGQNQYNILYFKTSNGSSNQSGFYGDASAVRFSDLGGSVISPSVFRIVQDSTSTYSVYGNFGAFSGTYSTYTVQHAATWVHSGTIVSTPTGTYIDITPSNAGAAAGATAGATAGAAAAEPFASAAEDSATAAASSATAAANSASSAGTFATNAANSATAAANSASSAGTSATNAANSASAASNSASAASNSASSAGTSATNAASSATAAANSASSAGTSASNAANSASSAANSASSAANSASSAASSAATAATYAVPAGGIIMWSGAIVNIPSGWVLCDGTNGTPDLRERFIVGAGGRNTTNPVDSGQNTDGYSVGEFAGSANAILVSHSHTPQIGQSFAISNPSGPDTGFLVAINEPTGKGNLSNTTSTIGESAINKNLPPYYALAFIMKTA